MKQATLRIKPHFSVTPHSAQQQQLDVIENAESNLIDHYTEQLISQSSGALSHSKNILIIGEEFISNEIKHILANISSDHSIATIDVNDPEIKKIKTNAQWLFDNFMLQEVINQFSWWKDYFIVLALTRNDPLLAMRLNQINYTLGISWIHGVIDGPFIFIGPTFISQSGPCYHCFEKRVTMNLHEYSSYQRYKEMVVMSDLSDNIIKKCSPPMYVLSAHLAVEIINYRYSKTCFTKSKALSIYLPTMEICFNEVLRLSSCLVCGLKK